MLTLKTPRASLLKPLAGTGGFLDQMARIFVYEPRARTTITNESNLTGGESVGGSSMASVAPAESSDDDGGGDDDPDPERRKVSPRKSKQSSNTPEVCNGLPSDGFVRLPQVLAVIPVSKSSWWAGCKSGRYPKPTKLGPRTTAWKVEDVRALIASV